jgi:hypothetical protein
MPLKRAAASLLAVAALLAGGATRAQAQASLSVDPASSSVRPGQSVSVTVDLGGAVDAYAFQFDVTYDPTLLELTSVTNGGFWPDDNFSPGLSGSGSVTFVYDLLTGPVSGLSGGGTLATLTFHALDGRFGSSPVQLANVILLDSRGKDIPLGSVTGATIDFIDDVPPVTTASVDPLPNANGWNATNVTVHLDATDSGSGVKEIHYALSGAASGSAVVSGASAAVTVSDEGSSTLTYYAVDQKDNAEDPHTLTLRVDKTAPVLSLPADITAEATSPAGAAVSFSASAHDALSGDLPVTLSVPPGSTFPLGTTTVSASATDLAGNTATGAFHVTVRDTTAPRFVELFAFPPVLWPPNHKLVPVTITARVADAADPAPDTHIVSVSSNDREDDRRDRHDDVDWEITGPLTLNLRAERSGFLPRIYTIVVESRDHSGNASQRSAFVIVP